MLPLLEATEFTGQESQVWQKAKGTRRGRLCSSPRLKTASHSVPAKKAVLPNAAPCSPSILNLGAVQASGEPDALSRGVKLIVIGGHISLAVAFKGQNVTLGLYKCNYSLTRGTELSAAAAAGQKQGARPDKTRWRAGFGLRALGSPPVF